MAWIGSAHAGASVLLAGTLTLGALHSVPTLAADPRQAAIEQVAREQGALPSDLEVVNERQATAEGGATLTALKVVDRRTGEIHSVYINGGVTGGDAGPAERHGSRCRPTDGTPAQGRCPPACCCSRPRSQASTLPVAIWTDTDPGPAEDAVRAAHPEVAWLAGRPANGTLDQLRALRAELWEARRAVYAAAADQLQIEIEAAGGTRRLCEHLRSARVRGSAAGRCGSSRRPRPEVMSIGLEGTLGHADVQRGPDRRRELDERRR